MRNTLKKYLKTAEKNRKNRTRGFAVLLILSVVVSCNVFMGLRQPGLTMAGTAMCGLEEHTHTESVCYELEQICGWPADGDEEEQEEQILICDPEAEPHEHTTSCYADSGTDAPLEQETAHIHNDTCYEKHFSCEKEEHTHTLDCYSDETADVETQLDWQEMFDGYVTGDLRADLVSVARSQIGYTESTRNFIVDSDGVRSGYTRYGAWYGTPYNDWSSIFVSFCLHYAGSDGETTPYNIGASSMAELWNNAGRYVTADEYDPESGDLIFFHNNTVGIVTEVDFDVLTVVQGDVENAVAEQTIMAYDSSIRGYGLLTVPELSASASPAAAEFILESCDCGNSGADAQSHSDSCAYKAQLTALAGEKTAEELYSLWDQLPADAQEYILQYLTNNAWQYGTKAEDLKALIESGAGSGPETNLSASCGNASFQIAGELPAAAMLRVEDPQYSQNTILSYINPNIRTNVNWMAVYDISIIADGAPCSPASPVTVTVTIPDLVFDPASEFFAVAHLDESTGEMISSEYVEVENNTVTFTATGFSPYLFYTVDKEVEGGERILGTNWITLRDSGYFTYWEQFLTDNDNETGRQTAAANLSDEEDPSDVQVVNPGGETDGKDGVIISKTIDGTDLENVFDITLSVQTQQSIQEIYEEPDMAVVIVMDISNTMTDNFGGETRYAAAMNAAENFLNQFAAKTGKVSKVGYVAFNTDAHEIFGLSSCSTTSEATKLKNTMRQETGKIINASEYGESHSRFTNVEAGLKMGADMLAGAPNENKYLIFLSDGFPTTYVKSGYSGYDPYTSSGTPGTDGVFYDYVRGCHCNYGTSYSDEAAIRAREAAASIKASGIKIFSIGVDVGGQTIARFERANNDFSIIDRTSTTYEIGDASSTESYKNWLKTSIGSGYYYDSTNSSSLQAAYKQIFEEILHLKEEASRADWVAQDPLPFATPEYLEFIGFYDIEGDLTTPSLTGSNAEGAENTAGYAHDSETSQNTITWDLKESGYQTSVSGGVTTYYYKLVYRVRLKNEQSAFVKETEYNTNDPTTLTYRIFESEDGKITLSQQKTLDFKIPSVEGYLVDLSFTKKDSYGKSLAGAEFELTHDTAACLVCRGDGETPVPLPAYTAVSSEDGTVLFRDIPSGHTYTLRETKAPPGYVSDGRGYRVAAAYGELEMEDDWNGSIINKTGGEFPSTGGPGILPYLITGFALAAASVIYGYIRRRGRERMGDV